MKNKKAFTIVEVLAVVVLLGVLATIALPTIQNYLDRARKEYNKQVEKELLISGKNYYADNRQLIPKLTYIEKKEMGEKKDYVTASELATRNYLKSTLTDYDGETCQDSYVIVAKNSTSDDEIWHSCLICGQGDNKKVHSKSPYCSLDVNWDDKEGATCEIRPTDAPEEGSFNTFYNSKNIDLEFTLLVDSPDDYEDGKNYSILEFYNKTTGKYTHKKIDTMLPTDIMIFKDINLKSLMGEDGVYSISIFDKGFNKSNICISDITIDNVPPSCEVKGNPTTWMKNATLTSKGSDNIGLHDTPYAWRNSEGEETEYSAINTYVINKNDTYTSIVRDKAGNTAYCPVKVDNIDSTPPSVPTYVAKYGDGTKYELGTWANNTVYTTITSSDSESGISKGGIQYQLKGTSTWTGFNFAAGPFAQNGTSYTGTEEWTATNGRENEYYFRACDKVGNCSGNSDEYIIRYDTTKPTVNISATMKTAGTSVSSGTWATQGLNFKLTKGTTGKSGYSIYYCKDTTNKCTPNNEVNSGELIDDYNTLSGTYYIRYKIVSGAGLSSSIGSYKAMVDTGVPSVSITAKKNSAGTSVSSGTWSNQGLKFTLTVDDVGTSGATIYYCKDTANSCSPGTKVSSGTSITNYTSTTGTYYIRYKAVSGTGVSSDVGSYKARVDTTAPTITQTANQTAISSKYVAPVDITSKCTDSGGSTISSFKVNGTSVSNATGTNSSSKVSTISGIDTTSIAVSCTDKAGNSASKTGSFTTFKPVSSVSISTGPSPLWIVVNGDSSKSQTSTAKATISPSNATTTGVTWESSNTSVLTISSTGVMTPKAVGSAKITATAKDGTGKSDSKTIYVYKTTTRSDTDISVNTTGGTSSGVITLTSHQVYATNGSSTVTLKVNGKHTSKWGTHLYTGSSASKAHCKAFARWICLTDSTKSPSGSTAIPYSACDSSLKLVKSRKTKWGNGSAFCGVTSLTMSAEGTYYIMLGGGVNVTSCTTCGTSSTLDFSAGGDSASGVYGDHINAKFTKYSLKISK